MTGLMVSFRSSSSYDRCVHTRERREGGRTQLFVPLSPRLLDGTKDAVPGPLSSLLFVPPSVTSPFHQLLLQ